MPHQERLYEKIINNPQTAEELQIALQNPRSPAYQQMMNMIMEDVVVVKILQRLIEQYIRTAMTIDQMEREAVAEKQRERYLFTHEEKMRKQQVLKLLPIVAYEAKGKKEEELINKRENLKSDITTLHTEIKKLKEEIKPYQEQKKQIDEQWNKRIESCVDQYDLTEEQKALLKKEGTHPPASEIATRVIESYEQQTQKDPEKRREMPGSHEFAAQLNVNVALKIVFAAAKLKQMAKKAKSESEDESQGEQVDRNIFLKELDAKKNQEALRSLAKEDDAMPSNMAKIFSAEGKQAREKEKELKVNEVECECKESVLEKIKNELKKLADEKKSKQQSTHIKKRAER